MNTNDDNDLSPFPVPPRGVGRSVEVEDEDEDEDDAIEPPSPAPASGDRPVRPSSRSSSGPSTRPSPRPSPSAARGGAEFELASATEEAEAAGAGAAAPPRAVSPELAAADLRSAAVSSLGFTHQQQRQLHQVRQQHQQDAGRGGGRALTPPRRRYTVEELTSRPRSNPRTRTPMRHTSPMGQILNRSTVHDDDDDERQGRGQSAGGGRATVRIGAGAAVGTVPALRSRLPSTPERRRPHQRPRSTRQGPSKRKVRRWDNDRFVGVATELARAGNGARGERAAEAFLRGEAEAGRYAYPKPAPRRTEFERMAENEGGKYTDVRERFVRGEVATGFNGERRGHPASSTDKEACGSEGPSADGAAQLLRIEPRLRAVLVRACSHRKFASRVAEAFESYLVRSAHGLERLREGGGDPADSDAVLKGVLLRPPSSPASAADESAESAARQRGQPSTHFHFPHGASSSGGGFHRLLLHVVCQFHGLGTSSCTSAVGDAPARILCVTGRMRGGGEVLLLDCIAQVGGDGGCCNADKDVERASSTNVEAVVGSVVGQLAALEVA